MASEEEGRGRSLSSSSPVSPSLLCTNNNTQSSFLLIPLLLLLMLLQHMITSCYGQDVWPKPQDMKTSPSDVYFIDPDNFRFILDPKSPQDCQLIDLSFKRYTDLTFGRGCRKWTPSLWSGKEEEENEKQEEKGTSQRHQTRKTCKRHNEYDARNDDETEACNYDADEEDEENSVEEGVSSRQQLKNLTIFFRFCENFPHESMDEAYTLMIGSRVKGGSILFADTVWGVIRGLESFSQLVYQSEESGRGDGKTFKVQASAILDFPRFPYRGVMIDTARHFIPVNVIKQNLDAMSYNKFNVFHWHLVDDQSFPYESKRFPNLHKAGAYNHKTHVYTQDDVRGVIEYARVRGIRVIPEFDTPGHTISWGKSNKDLLTECYNNETLLPTGTFGPIDPTKQSTYRFLEEFYRELKSVFPDTVFHLGGDEVDFTCWKSNPQITKFMADKGIETYEKLESYYVQRLIKIVDNLNKSMIVWQEVFDNKVTIDTEKCAVHVWMGYDDEWRHELFNVTKSGNKAILSSPWYLNIIKYGVDWPNFYNMEPISFNGTAEQNERVIGGSVCMWTEFVDATGIIPRTWPRASAVAERLWSAIDVNNATAAVPRIKKMQCLMQQRGLRVEPINGPGFCSCDHVFE